MSQSSLALICVALFFIMQKKYLTPRQKIYRNNRLKGMSMYNAAVAAGFSKAYARKQRLDRIVGDSMNDILEQKGVTDGMLAEKIFEALEATKETGHPDWTTRLKALELVCKIKGNVKDTFNFNLNNSINIAPEHTIIFTDIDDCDEEPTDAEIIHAEESAPSDRGEGSL